MHPHRRRSRLAGRLAAVTTSLTIALAGALVAPSSAAAADGEPALPEFAFSGRVIDKAEMDYNPTNEFIFPSIFHAGEHLADPLGEWYLYYAPHDSPGGISLLYADSLDGPWTEYAENPLIANEWPPHYDRVSHVSSPDAVWDDATGQVLLYFHGENSTTRWASSADGVTFDDSGVAVTNADGGPGTTETSYARVFPHPDPDSAYRWGMFYMQNRTDNIRRIKMAESVDGKSWDVRAEPVVVPDAATGQNVSGGNLLTWEGQHYLTYHGSSGVTYARAVDPTVTEIGPQRVLHRSSGVGDDVGRVAAPEVVTEGEDTYLFYESGDRLGATIAYATRVEPTPPDPDPLREQCSGAASDEFDGAALDGALWDVVNPDGARHAVADGALTVPTYGTGVAGAPFPVQAVPDGPWEVTTEVDVDPRERYQQAGLILHTAGDTYAKLDHGFGSNGLRFSYIWRQDGAERNASIDTPPVPVGTGTTVWLRLTSDGTNVLAAASTDGQEFATIGRPVPLAELAPTGVGVSALRGATAAPEIEATFDWFRWTPTAQESAACDAPDATWDATAVYDDGATVAYDGATWEALWWSSGDVPGASVHGPWAEQGAASGCGTAWTASAVHHSGDVVVHAGHEWSAAWWTRGQEPGASPWGPWQDEGECA
ncbi:DUF1349 domain-containing protein [Isoptericola sp. S6320L]|uniref:DUF1349 domain-containing protein n=1 Tax=Isoptericola sp. S6320L TaxID=2926411 RepID=UPI001FF161A2|nr:DUF1349 domain-containing protein [Isoptericola sp. S6320L]MCK0116077.1 DUF1349 domain-containing protein [Isoptericola sp. S6320L]